MQTELEQLKAENKSLSDLLHQAVLHINDLEVKHIELTDEQHEDLVNSIVVVVKNTCDISMGDVPNIYDAAHQAVNDWALKFNIQLPK